MNNELIVTIDENDRAAVTHPMPIFDYAAMRAEQLHALTQTIMGQGFENFSHCNENIQHNVLWLIQSLAEELKPCSMRCTSAIPKRWRSRWKRHEPR